ncbi:MAG: hypothetical protein RLT05_22190 [Bauldia litoralis]
MIDGMAAAFCCDLGRATGASTGFWVTLASGCGGVDRTLDLSRENTLGLVSKGYQTTPTSERNLPTPSNELKE